MSEDLEREFDAMARGEVPGFPHHRFVGAGHDASWRRWFFEALEAKFTVRVPSGKRKIKL